jgi:hypothetical protein
MYAEDALLFNSGTDSYTKVTTIIMLEILFNAQECSSVKFPTQGRINLERYCIQCNADEKLSN